MTLTLNAGSSSLKFALYDLAAGPGAQELAAGLFARIGEGAGTFTFTQGGEEVEEAFVGDHAAAFRRVGEVLDERGLRAGVDAVGHRVVHGGEEFRAPTVVTPAVEAAIERLAPLAPLHNPANLTGIRLAREVFAQAGHVAVFDTAFHATLPPVAYRYAVPQAWYREYGVRKYGFHGTSHAYVSAAARAHLGADRASEKLVSLHLGNGCSAAAVLDGVCVDTSMGLTPVAGLVMGTRSGDVDPGLAAFLAGRGLDVDAQNAALNKASGLLALGGDNDMRALLSLRDTGDAGARLAVDVFTYRLRKTVGAYAAALGGLDALVFTAGIGEHAAAVRAEVCAGLDFLGVTLDEQANAGRESGIRDLGRGRVAVLVVPTNEELAIAEAARAVLAKG